MFDLIGDIHGYADELTALLALLGYRRSGDSYQHPTRRAIFLGDFIDRGPKIKEVLGIVRPMVESGAALAVMGNHEFNALAFHTPHRDRPGEYLRPHAPKNVNQHQATLDQIEPTEFGDYLRWFRSLPLWLDLEGLRVVHACWDCELLWTIDKKLNGSSTINDDFLHEACDQKNFLYHAVDVVLKGKEAKLPAGITFLDKDGHERDSIRTKWYLPSLGQTYQDYALQSNPIECKLALPDNVIAAARPYPPGSKPVFVGHYWLSAAQPEILASNVACLDYSVAKGGMLCAYRWNGESTLDNANFVTVSAGQAG